MSEGTKRIVRMTVIGLLGLAASVGQAAACTVVVTAFGMRAEGDCFLFEEIKRRQPNLVVPFVDAHPNGTSVITELQVRNTGAVGSEGEVTFVVRSLDGEYHPRGGRFDVTLYVEARDMDGRVVQVWREDTAQWHNSVEYRENAARLGPGDRQSYFFGPFHLPDRDRNYDICMHAIADPSSQALPGGEIWETIENDNYRLGGVRLFPQTGDPDYETPICFD